MLSLKEEKVSTFWKFGYFKLYNDQGELENDDEVFLEMEDDEEATWKKLFWRFYWKMGYSDD